MPKSGERAVARGGPGDVTAFRRALVLAGFLVALTAPGAGGDSGWQYPDMELRCIQGFDRLATTPRLKAVPVLPPGREDPVLVFVSRDRDDPGQSEARAIVRMTDGTRAGTQDLGCPWPADAWPGIPGLHDGQAWFLAGNDAGEVGLYRSDGTRDGTVEAIAPAGNPGFAGIDLLSFRGRLYLPGMAAGSADWTLFSTDGTAAGTGPVVSTALPAVAAPLEDLFPMPRPAIAWPAGDLLYFCGRTQETGWELWRTDGTEAGTFLLRDIRPGPEDTLPPSWTSTHWFPDGPLAAGSRLCFAADDGAGGSEPWWTDGTPEGTVRIADLNPGAASSRPRFLGEAGAGVLFFAEDGAGAAGLFATDGTPEGTRAVYGFASGKAATDLWPLGPLGDALYFAMSDRTGPLALWRTDGTPEGTAFVKDLGRPGHYRRAEAFRPLGHSGLAFFRTPWSDWEPGLWLTDGTAEGTRQVHGGSDHLPFRGTVFTFSMDEGLDRVVPVGLGLSSCDVDDDGDEFSTEIEIAAGTRWWDAGSTPLGPEGGGPEGDLDVRKMEFSVTAWVLDADELRIEGTLPVRAGFVPAGARIVFDVAGAVRIFTVDRRGRAREGDTEFRLRVRRSKGIARANPAARFRFIVRGAHLMEAFAEEGVWEPRVTVGRPIVLPVTVLLDGRPFRARVPLLWTVPAFGEGSAVLDR